LKTTLASLASIRTGIFARPEESGDLVYLQSKYFDEDGELVQELHGDLKLANVSEKHLLKPGEVLFAAKGPKNFATAFEGHNAPAVASTSFFVIHVGDGRILPEYLAWFINLPETKLMLKTSSQSTSIPSISKTTLEALEVPVPSVELQKRILIITTLRKKEIELKIKIEALRQTQIQHQISQLLK
jgi:restriction endonuclease S subunit